MKLLTLLLALAGSSLQAAPRPLLTFTYDGGLFLRHPARPALWVSLHDSDHRCELWKELGPSRHGVFLSDATGARRRILSSWNIAYESAVDGWRVLARGTPAWWRLPETVVKAADGKRVWHRGSWIGEHASFFNDPRTVEEPETGATLASPYWSYVDESAGTCHTFRALRATYAILGPVTLQTVVLGTIPEQEPAWTIREGSASQGNTVVEGDWLRER